MLDTVARWRAPIYEDIGRFLLALKASKLRVFGAGILYDARTIEQHERQFLCGYFERDCIPWTTVRLFEIQALMDKWSSLVQPVDVNRRIWLGNRAVIGIRVRFIRRYFQRLLREIEGSSSRTWASAVLPDQLTCAP